MWARPASVTRRRDGSRSDVSGSRPTCRRPSSPTSVSAQHTWASRRGVPWYKLRSGNLYILAMSLRMFASHNDKGELDAFRVTTETGAHTRQVECPKLRRQGRKMGKRVVRQTRVGHV
jgi:hypothetical protein